MFAKTSRVAISSMAHLRVSVSTAGSFFNKKGIDLKTDIFRFENQQAVEKNLDDHDDDDDDDKGDKSDKGDKGDGYDGRNDAAGHGGCGSGG